MTEQGGHFDTPEFDPGYFKVVRKSEVPLGEAWISGSVPPFPVPLFQQFADSGATEFPIRNRFPDEGPSIYEAVTAPTMRDLEKRAMLDEIEMAKRFGPVRPPAGLCGRTGVCETCPTAQRDMLAAELAKVEQRLAWWEGYFAPKFVKGNLPRPEMGISLIGARLRLQIDTVDCWEDWKRPTFDPVAVTADRRHERVDQVLDENLPNAVAPGTDLRQLCRKCGASESAEWHRSYWVEIDKTGTAHRRGAHPFEPVEP